MSNTKVAVLGGTGMLGAMLVDVLARDPGFTVAASGRNDALIESISRRIDNVAWGRFDVEFDNLESFDLLSDVDWIVNAIGITKPVIEEDDAAKIERAIRINSLFPHELNAVAEKTGARVLQIATDYVYSGLKGDYSEKNPHDPTDVYGKTKSLGEVIGGSFFNLRCSVIGPEPKKPKFLLEWFLGQPIDGQVNGFTNHKWNGVTTLHFAKVAAGIIKENIDPVGAHNFIPSGRISKADLLKVFAECYDRRDIVVVEIETPTMVDRTLATENKGFNDTLWKAAGYKTLPTIEAMVKELSDFNFRFIRDTAERTQ